jgi:hypothetical protein
MEYTPKRSKGPRTTPLWENAHGRAKLPALLDRKQEESQRIQCSLFKDRHAAESA